MDEDLLSISPASRGQLVKTLITLETHGIMGIFRSNFACYCPATGMQNGDDALLSIISASRGHLVKMLIFASGTG